MGSDLTRKPDTEGVAGVIGRRVAVVAAVMSMVMGGAISATGAQSGKDAPRSTETTTVSASAAMRAAELCSESRLPTLNPPPCR